MAKSKRLRLSYDEMELQCAMAASEVDFCRESIDNLQRLVESLRVERAKLICENEKLSLINKRKWDTLYDLLQSSDDETEDAEGPEVSEVSEYPVVPDMFPPVPGLNDGLIYTVELPSHTAAVRSYCMKAISNMKPGLWYFTRDTIGPNPPFRFRRIVEKCCAHHDPSAKGLLLKLYSPKYWVIRYNP